MPTGIKKYGPAPLTEMGASTESNSLNAAQSIMASRSSTKKQKSRPERIERTDAFIRKLLKLYTKQNAYFPVQGLSALNIICGSLDFETGESTDGWGRFFEPVSMKSMRNMLQAKNPGAVCYSGTVSPNRDNWYNANTIWPHLEMWLYTAEDDSAPGVMDEAGWYFMESVSPHASNCSSFYRYKINSVAAPRHSKCYGDRLAMCTGPWNPCSSIKISRTHTLSLSSPISSP